MAEVVPFPSERVSSEVTVSRHEGCHVLIFPGVRIERHRDEGTTAEPAAKGAGSGDAEKKGRTGT